MGTTTIPTTWGKSSSYKSNGYQSNHGYNGHNRDNTDYNSYVPPRYERFERQQPFQQSRGHPFLVYSNQNKALHSYNNPLMVKYIGYIIMHDEEHWVMNFYERMLNMAFKNFL